MDFGSFGLGLDSPTTPTPKPPKRQQQWQLSRNPKSPTGIKHAIKTPTDVAFIANNFFVAADSDGHRLLIFDNNGRLVTVLCNEQVWPNSGKDILFN